MIIGKSGKLILNYGSNHRECDYPFLAAVITSDRTGPDIGYLLV